MAELSLAEQRYARKRAEILAAASDVFTTHGYLGASMDAVATAAGASKRTVYQYFADKEELFSSVVLDAVDRGYEFFRPHILALADADADDLIEAFRRHARLTISGIMAPQVLRMRRLVMAEADRFPEIGREYYERSWVRTLDLLARTLARLDERGLLKIPNPERAAYMFTWLVVSMPLQRTAFMGNAAMYTQAELDDIADEAVRVFLAAH
ncbi:TetR/AcrR family transcriptional regulator [Nonomuraea sp. NPDC059194]|uniref:TetR/AcrR family transcriptional regulator n=1 Tax=Nonomuraea sp. NPDC059194 TaxID=3346764 RepID=UPI0036777980